MRKRKNYWNKTNSFRFALKYSNKRDFKKNYIGAYEFLRKNKLLSEACEHMKLTPIVSSQLKWNYVECKRVAEKSKTLNGFRTNYPRAYIISKENGWISEFSSHFIKYEKKIYWTKIRCQEEANKYEYRVDFSNGSPNAYAACYRNGWIDGVCNHMFTPHVKSFVWTKEKCKKIAIKYKHRKEFQTANSRAYSAARHNGWLDEICEHMEYKKLPNNYWHDFENCKLEALKYKTKSDFVKNAQHVYKISREYSWLEKICDHMIPVGDKFNRCIYSYEFPNNRVYVGLTYNINKRQISRNKDKKDAVTKYINETGLTPIRKQLTDYVPVIDAMRLEGVFLDKYINDGWAPLNRAKTGGIGGRRD